MSRRRKSSRPGSRYVGLPHWLLDSPAYRSLSGDAVKILIDIWKRHNGVNNGEISYGVREAAQIGIARSTASRMLETLIERGFLVVVRDSAFNLKTREVRTWRLTAEPYRGEAGSKDFVRWVASTVPPAGLSNANNSPTSGTVSPTSGTVSNNITPYSPAGGTVRAQNSPPTVPPAGHLYITIPTPVDCPQRHGEAKPPESNLERESLPVRSGNPSARCLALVEGDPAIRDPRAYAAAVKADRRDKWLDGLTRYVAHKFVGRAQWEAYEAIEEARLTGSRQATPRHIRKALDDIDELCRLDAGRQQVG